MTRLFISVALIAFAGNLFAASGGYENLDTVYVNLDDRKSLQQGAATFASYCLSCHGIKYMRYNRMAEDLGISDDVLRENFLVGAQKPSDRMDVNMADEDAKRWFGTAPPDLSLTARSRSPEWIYTFLRGFRKDDGSVTGWNNSLYADVAMPHVLYRQQQNLQAEDYDSLVRDIVNFLVYVAEPAKLVRYKVGILVLGFLGLFTVLAYLLKKEYWKDIH